MAYSINNNVHINNNALFILEGNIALWYHIFTTYEYFSTNMTWQASARTLQVTHNE